MNIGLKYIILLADETTRASEIRNLVSTLDYIKMDVVHNVSLLMELVEKQSPHVILIYVASHEPGYVDHIKNIRKDLTIDKVPVMVLSVAPSVEEIINLAR